ncbi:MAG: hypothetical protein U0531_20050 [Dehalococcoidia bacterium]
MVAERLSPYYVIAGVTGNVVRSAVQSATKAVRTAHSSREPVPNDPRDLTFDQVLAFAQSFAAEVVENPSAGEVAMSFARSVLYLLGVGDPITQLQRDGVLSLCASINLRPAPALRWSHFVRSHVDDTKRLRWVLSACLESKKRLSARLKATIADNRDQLGLPERPRVLVLGYSQTVVSVIEALVETTTAPIQVITPRIHLPGRDRAESRLLSNALEKLLPAPIVRLVSKEESLDLCRAGGVDLVVSGCMLIGRIDNGGIEVIQRNPAATLAAQAHEIGMATLIASGMYKIWPMRFYKDYKHYALSVPPAIEEYGAGTLIDSKLTWIATERGLFSSHEFGHTKIAQAYFRSASIDLPSILSACDTDDALQRVMADVDELMQDLAQEDAHLDVEPPSEEMTAYIVRQELPGHFLEAERTFRALIDDDEWYHRHHAKYVSIMGAEVVAVADSPAEALESAWSRRGYRPMFTRLVERDPSIIKLRPRLLPR